MINSIKNKPIMQKLVMLPLLVVMPFSMSAYAASNSIDSKSTVSSKGVAKIAESNGAQSEQATQNKTVLSKSTSPDCDSLNIMLMSLKNQLAINANWQSNDAASNTKKTISMGDLTSSGRPDFAITCPNFTAKYDGNALKIKADSYQDILNHLHKQLNRGVDLYNYRWYKNPKVKNEFQVDKYSIDLGKIMVTDGYSKLAEGRKLSLKQSFVPSAATISYKVDDSELKPLLRQKTISNYSADFKAANKIDIFHKNPDIGSRGFGIERIFIDKKNGILEIYKNYDFPQQSS